MDLDGQRGCAIFVPFRAPLASPAQLQEQARRLWCAECDRAYSAGRDVSGSFGSVGMLVNPGTDSLGLAEAWRGIVANSTSYGAISCARSEEPILDRTTGCLSFHWPRAAQGTELDVDLILAVANDPTIQNGEYATPDVVARMWREKSDRSYYFANNQWSGIRTRQDPDIERSLRNAFGPARSN